jgi:hypothetical protein
VKVPTVIAAASLALLAGWWIATDPAVGATGEPPRKVNTIRHLYPDLHTRELRRTPTSWHRLRKMARERYARRNPCQTWTLERYTRLGAPPWAIVERTWRCDGMDEWRIDYLGCIADHEGGRTYPDVSYGGGRGYGPLRGNIVFGHLQIRPGWYRGMMEGNPGRYAGDYWTWDLYQWARNPVNQARTAEHIPHSHYATAGLC